MNKDLMRYIPKEYKNEVADIYEDGKEWNDYTNRWNVLVTVEWKDGETNTYQNKSYMKAKLTELGRD